MPKFKVVRGHTSVYVGNDRYLYLKQPGEIIEVDEDMAKYLRRSLCVVEVREPRKTAKKRGVKTDGNAVE